MLRGIATWPHSVGGAVVCVEVQCWQGLCPLAVASSAGAVCTHAYLLTRVLHMCLLTRECFLGFPPGPGLLVRVVGQVRW